MVFQDLFFWHNHHSFQINKAETDKVVCKEFQEPIQTLDEFETCKEQEEQLGVSFATQLVVGISKKAFLPKIEKHYN